MYAERGFSMKDRIKALRNELKLTQTEFAERIGISRSALTKLESGENVPSGATVKLIVNEFKVNEIWLRDGEGEMFRSMSEQEELATWLAEINAMPTSSAQRRVARMLTMLEPNDWITIDKMIKALIDDNKEE